jgi:hypothetical protein
MLVKDDHKDFWKNLIMQHYMGRFFFANIGLAKKNLTGTNIASPVKKINKVLYLFQLVLATDKAQI